MDKLTALAMIGASIYEPYIERFYDTDRPRRVIPREPRPLTEREKRIAIKHRPMREFTINGRKVMAYSRKDAITRLKHKK